MDITEALDEPAFYILGGGGTIAVLLGYIMSKKTDLMVLPFWQLIIIILTVLVASAYFSTRD